MENLRKNWLLILIGLATVVLGIIAIITAWKLYQLRRVPVAPTVPAPAPAVEVTPTPTPPCALDFCIPSPTPTSTVTPTPTPTGTPTPTPTPIPECWDECSSDEDCPEALECQEIDGIDRCVNADCPEEEDCICPELTPTPTATPTPTPTGIATPTPTATTTPVPTATPTPVTIAEASPTPVPEIELPEAGFSLPTIGFILGGILLLGISFLIAF